MRRAVAALAGLGWLLLADAALAGRFEGAGFPSVALARDLPYQIYLPEGEPPVKGWPVVYLLHGLGGRETDWRDLGRIGHALDGLIEEGRLSPLAVVMPYGDNGWYVDSAAYGGPGDWARAIGDELLRAVEEAHPLDGGRRAIAGLSMGGYGALRLAFIEPGRYRAVASLSGAVWPDVPAAERGLPLGQVTLLRETGWVHRVGGRGGHFQGAFGEPFDPRRFNRLNVFALLDGLLAAGRAPPPTYLAVGDDDGLDLWEGAYLLFEAMRAQDLPVELRVVDGGHRWAVWREMVEGALVFLGEHLRPPP